MRGLKRYDDVGAQFTELVAPSSDAWIKTVFENSVTLSFTGRTLLGCVD